MVLALGIKSIDRLKHMANASLVQTLQFFAISALGKAVFTGAIALYSMTWLVSSRQNPYSLNLYEGDVLSSGYRTVCYKVTEDLAVLVKQCDSICSNDVLVSRFTQKEVLPSRGGCFPIPFLFDVLIIAGYAGTVGACVFMVLRIGCAAAWRALVNARAANEDEFGSYGEYPSGNTQEGRSTDSSLGSVSSRLDNVDSYSSSNNTNPLRGTGGALNTLRTAYEFEVSIAFKVTENRGFALLVLASFLSTVLGVIVFYRWAAVYLQSMEPGNGLLYALGLFVWQFITLMILMVRHAILIAERQRHDCIGETDSEGKGMEEGHEVDVDDLGSESPKSVGTDEGDQGSESRPALKGKRGEGTGMTIVEKIKQWIGKVRDVGHNGLGEIWEEGFDWIVKKMMGSVIMWAKRRRDEEENERRQRVDKRNANELECGYEERKRRGGLHGKNDDVDGDINYKNNDYDDDDNDDDYDSTKGDANGKNGLGSPHEARRKLRETKRNRDSKNKENEDGLVCTDLFPELGLQGMMASMSGGRNPRRHRPRRASRGRANSAGGNPCHHVKGKGENSGSEAGDEDDEAEADDEFDDLDRHDVASAPGRHGRGKSGESGGGQISDNALVSTKAPSGECSLRNAGIDVPLRSSSAPLSPKTHGEGRSVKGKPCQSRPESEDSEEKDGTVRRGSVYDDEDDGLHLSFGNFFADTNADANLPSINSTQNANIDKGKQQRSIDSHDSSPIPDAPSSSTHMRAPISPTAKGEHEQRHLAIHMDSETEDEPG